MDQPWQICTKQRGPIACPMNPGRRFPFAITYIGTFHLPTAGPARLSRCRYTSRSFRNNATPSCDDNAIVKKATARLGIVCASQLQRLRRSAVPSGGGGDLPSTRHRDEQRRPSRPIYRGPPRHLISPLARRINTGDIGHQTSRRQ